MDREDYLFQQVREEIGHRGAPDEGDLTPCLLAFTDILGFEAIRAAQNNDLQKAVKISEAQQALEEAFPEVLKDIVAKNACENFNRAMGTNHTLEEFKELSPEHLLHAMKNRRSSQ
jgi:hypothetical protein